MDAVGTVIQPNPTVASAYQAVGRLHGIELEQETIRARFREAIRRFGVRSFQQSRGIADPYRTDEASEHARWEAIVDFVLRPSPSQHSALFHSLWDHFGNPANWVLFDDVMPALNILEQQGVLLGLASNFDGRLRPITEQLLGDFDLTLFISSEVGWVKPDSSFYTEVTRQLDVETNRIMLIGDDWENDVAGPRACGWQAGYLNRNSRSGDSPAEVGFKDLKEAVTALFPS